MWVFMCAQSCLTHKNIVARQSPLSTGLSWQEYGVGCHFFLQGIFPTQGPNPSFLLFFVLAGDSLPLSYLGSSSTSSQMLGSWKIGMSFLLEQFLWCLFSPVCSHSLSDTFEWFCPVANFSLLVQSSSRQNSTFIMKYGMIAT